MAQKITYVIADNYGDDLSFRIVDSVKGISPVYVIPGKAYSIGGNPYIVYGDHVKEWTETGKYDQTIHVAQITSGRLDPNEQ